MSNVHCQFEMDTRNADKPLTVGDAFTMICDGETPRPVSSDIQFVFANPKEKYTLHVLKLKESQPGHFKLLVTSYLPNDTVNVVMTLADGDLQLQTNPLSWSVNSVLKPQDPPEPVPSFGPFSLSYPLWFWLLLAALILAVIGVIGGVLWRQSRRRRRQVELEQFKTIVPPFVQLSKDLRAIKRKLAMATNNKKQTIDLVQKLERDFRLYLIREFMIPALQVGDRQLLAELRRSHFAVYEQMQSNLRRLFSEFAKARNDRDQITERDCEGLLHLTRKTTDELSSLKRRKS